MFSILLFALELKPKSQANQQIIMGDDILRPFQRQLIADDLAAQATHTHRK